MKGQRSEARREAGATPAALEAVGGKDRIGLPKPTRVLFGCTSPIGLVFDGGRARRIAFNRRDRN
jgi:hypothetical protein